MKDPRNIAGPVVRGTDLWGRSTETEHLKVLLERGSVLLTGPRRHGKSSLMYSIVDGAHQDVMVILLDVEWVESPEEFLTTATAELLALDRVRQLMAAMKSTPSLLRGWVSSAIDEVAVGAPNVGELKIRLRHGLEREHWQELAEQM